MNKIDLKYYYILLLSLVLTLTFCGKVKGEFGFRTFVDDNYKKHHGKLEIDTNKEVKWVYNFSDLSNQVKVGVIYLKKEIVWAEIFTKVETLSPSNQNIFGSIKEFPEGKYKIVLINVDEENELIDEQIFTVYDDEAIE